MLSALQVLEPLKNSVECTTLLNTAEKINPTLLQITEPELEYDTLLEDIIELEEELHNTVHSILLEEAPAITEEVMSKPDTLLNNLLVKLDPLKNPSETKLIIDAAEKINPTLLNSKLSDGDVMKPVLQTLDNLGFPIKL